MMLSKNVNNKKYAPKLIFFNEKKIEKYSDNFWYRKLTLKVKRLGDFALFDTSPLIQFSKFNNYLWVCSFLGKNLPNFLPPVWKLHNPYCHSSGLDMCYLFRLETLKVTQVILGCVEHTVLPRFQNYLISPLKASNSASIQLKGFWILHLNHESIYHLIMFF